MLNPAYIREALGKGKGQDDAAQEEPRAKKSFGMNNDAINLKLKQCYEAAVQIKPFYSGGKISVIDDQEFVCLHGSSLKVLRKQEVIKIEEVEGQDPDAANSQRAFRPSVTVVRNIEVELDDILCFDTCPISKVVITAHKSSLLRIWCLITGQLLNTVKSLHNMPINFVEFCPAKSLETMKGLPKTVEEVDAIETTRSQLWWTTLSGSAVKLWQLGGNQMSKLLRIENITAVGYVRWNSTSLYAAERHIYVMGVSPETNQFTLEYNLEGHYSQVTGIEFTEDLMISSGKDKVLILWDRKARGYTKLKTIPFDNPIEAIYLPLSPDLFVATNPSNIYHFNITKHKVSKTPVLSLNENETVTGFHCGSLPSSSLQSWFISSHVGSIYESVACKDECKEKSKLSIIQQYVGDLQEILSVALWMNEKVVVANNTDVIKVFNLHSGKCEFLRGHKDIVLSVTCQKEWMLSASKDNQIIFWNIKSIDPHTVLSAHLASVSAVCFNPTHDNMVYSVSEDKFLKLWDRQRLLEGVVAHEKEINSVHCSPNGALVATASRDKSVKLWDSGSLALLTQFKGHKKGVWDVKFSQWDQLIASASADTTIKIWSLTSYNCIQTLQGHLSSVLQVQFINQGLQLVSVGSDAVLKSWDLKTSTCILTEECGDDKIWAMDASSDGNIVITGSADSVLTLWHDVTEEKVAEKVEKKRKQIVDEQKLRNLLYAKEWNKAFLMALHLDRPFTLLKVIREAKDVSQFSTVLSEIDDDLLFNLMNYITKWNTNTRTSTEAQTLLHLIITNFSHDHLKRVVQPMHLLSYTEKHHDRVYRMMKQISFLQFLCTEHGKISSVDDDASLL